MREEEDLISKIERSPEDADARLVYADWLEDRGDRRSALLRAKPGSLPVIETGLSVAPEWLARVDQAAIERCDYPDRSACPGRWEALPPGQSPRKRQCGVCHREVTHCASIVEARPIADGGRPVCVGSIVPRHPYDLAPIPMPPINPPAPRPITPVGNLMAPPRRPEPEIKPEPGPIGPPGNPPPPEREPTEARRWWQFWRR